MSGANNVPLGNRPPGLVPTFGKAVGAAVGPSDSGSLLKPSYLQHNNGSGFPGPHQAGAPGGRFESHNVKRPNMDIINSINAALGHKAGTAPPPLVAPGACIPDSVAAATAAATAAAAAAARKAAESASVSIGVSSSVSGGGDGPDRKRKRKSRWGGTETDKTFIPGMPTMLPSNLTKEQEEAYLLQLKIEDASRRLRTGDFGIPPNPEDRSPSPEPIYSSDGKRMNTREYRKRKQLEEMRHEAIVRIMQINGDYTPPSDYKPPQIKVNDKVMIPQEEHPEINFVGLLIGPRGNTLKAMEKDTGAKIIIRGKGSVKEGKVGRKDGQPLPGEDEPLHAYVTATTLESVKMAVDKIREVITQGVEVPEGQNDLRRNQLRELALLNGTLREGDGPRCSNCGADDHKSWQCQDRANVTNNIVCTSCGGIGHPASDCMRDKSSFDEDAKNNIDEEYMSLMAELGEGPPPPSKSEGRGWQESSGRSAFGKPSGPPRQLMGPRASFPPSGPPPPPPGGSGAKPPSLMHQNVPPPWGEGARQWNEPPPPGAPPQSGQGRGGGNQWGPPPSGGPPGGGYGASSYLGAPPPPPPPTTTSGGSSISSSSSSWNSSGGWGAGAPPPPPPGAGPSQVAPVPPPSGSAPSTNMPPPGWGGWSSWQGAPPPPPPQGGSSNRVNLSSLIAAPPPPPPS